ncbi:MAG TPA: condensation domain-containing protein, partial [Candidatus Binataceae bacterium]
MTLTLESQFTTIEGFPLSPQQDHLWSLQSDGQITPYRVHCVVRIDGILHSGILAKALADVWSKHEILRTSIQKVHDATAPLQIVLDKVASSGSDSPSTEHPLALGTEDSTGQTQTLGGPPLVNTYDLTGYSSSQQETRIEELRREANRLPFDFSRGRLSHITLVTLCSTRHALLISQSALSADATSLRLLVHEITLAYSARMPRAFLSDEASVEIGRANGSQHATPTGGSVQYVDLGEWQRAILESDDAKPGRDYWRQQQFGSATLNSIHEPYTTGNREFNPLFLTSTITPDSLLKIKTIAQKYSVPWITFLLACWQSLLWRLSNNPNPVVGVACDARNYPGLQEALGPFAKYLPIRSYLDKRVQFSDL